MQEHRFLFAFAGLIGDFLGIFERNSEIVRTILETCARALIQGQDVTSMRDTFEFERIQHFNTQYLTQDDYTFLNEFLAKTEASLNENPTSYRIFFREIPDRVTWMRSSIPNWAFSAALVNTLGPIQNRDGRRFWIDLYQIVSNNVREIWMDGFNKPILYLAPNEPIIPKMVSVFQGRPIIGIEMGEGNIWIQAKLLVPTLGEELYCGLKVSKATLSFPGINPALLRVIPNPFNQYIRATLIITLAPEAPHEEMANAFGIDARLAKVEFPETIRISFLPGNSTLDEIGGRGHWNVYGDENVFAWNNQKPSFDSLLNAVSIPMNLDREEFIVQSGQSPIFGFGGNTKAENGAWILPAAKLAAPLLAKGAGCLKLSTSSGLSSTFSGFLDANQVDIANYTLNQAIITASPDELQIFAIRATTQSALQNYRIWVNPEATQWNTLQFKQKGVFPLIYHCHSGGTESYTSIGDCETNLDRPVNAAGQSIGILSRQSLLWRSFSADIDHFVLFDENIIKDQQEDHFQSQALALNNALFTVSPINGVLLSGQLPPFSNTFYSTSLIYAFGLLGYLPTLPDPYAANTGIYRQMLTQMQGREGQYAFDQINKWLIGSMYSQNANPPELKFIFGDSPAPGRVTSTRINLLDNLQLADAISNSDFEARNAKLIRRVGQRVDRGIQSWLYENDLHIQINDQFRHYNFFSLLDVSTAADWMGVNVGFMDERFFFERTFDVVPNQNALSADGMDVVATGKFVRLFTLPQISWEPVINITKPFDGANDPPAGLLLFKNDGSPTTIGNTGGNSISIAPLPLAAYIEKNYQEDSNFKAWSFFTLPFGLLAIARYNQKLPDGRKGATIELVRQNFGTEVQTSLQISTKGYEDIDQKNRNFEGATRQLYNIHGQGGEALNKSILSATVTEIFNAEFSDGPTLKQRGVPVERYDFSGYGANIFSNWLNAKARIGQTSQAKFDVWRGRTAHEVIQVRSIIYPWAIRVVRTITMFRESTGLVYRVDSGWRAESDGVYDFKTPLVVGKDLQNKDIIVYEPEGTGNYNFHPGIVKGVFDVRNILETQDVNTFSKTWIKTTGYYINPDDGKPLKVPITGQNLSVSLFPVYFDADVEIKGVIQGATNGRVPSKKMLGFIQISPQGIPISDVDFAALLAENNGLGGNVDCLVNIAGSGQTMRINRVEVRPSTDAGKISFVTAAKGTPILPKDGSWSIVQHKKASKEVVPISNGSVPLIQRGLLGTISNQPLEIADPTDLFNTNLEDRATQFAFLQNTDTQKVLFRNPYFEDGQKLLKSSPPDLADAYRLLDSKGIFPRLDGLPRMDLTNFNLDIVEKGYKLQNKINEAEELLAQKLPEGPFYIVDEKDIKIYIEYAKKDIKGNKLSDGILNFNIDSVAQKWVNKMNDITMVVDLLDMKRLFLIRGKFDTEKGKLPSFDKPELEFGEPLKPIYDILQILLLLNGGEYAEALTKGLKIAMSNSPNNWAYKFQADKEIPLLRFPPPIADSPVAPLRLECYLKLGCYFNVGNPLASQGASLVPSGGGFVEFGAKLSVMCVSLAAATVYAVGTCSLRIGADTVTGPNLYLKVGFGVELMVGLPVIGSVSVYYGAGVEIYIDTREIIAGAFIVFRGRAELIGGLVTIQILIEAAGKIAARIGEGSNGRTDMIAQVTFSLDISIFLVINISFSETFEERRQIS